MWTHTHLWLSHMHTHRTKMSQHKQEQLKWGWIGSRGSRFTMLTKTGYRSGPIKFRMSSITSSMFLFRPIGNHCGWSPMVTTNQTCSGRSRLLEDNKKTQYLISITSNTYFGLFLLGMASLVNAVIRGRCILLPMAGNPPRYFRYSIGQTDI